MRYSNAILILTISLASCAAPVVVAPEISRPGYAALKESQPDCAREISALETAPAKSDALVLDALYCYRRVWKHWENEYRILDAALDAASGGGGRE